MQTGPKTAQGKATSSMNAMSHGLTSSKTILPGENPAGYQRLLEMLIEEHRPTTPTEALLVQDMADAHWRLDRVRSRQDQAFESEILDSKLLALLHRYAVTYERSFFKALETLKKLQQQRRTQPKLDFVSQKKEDADFLKLLESITAPRPGSNPLPHPFDPSDGASTTHSAQC